MAGFNPIEMMRMGERFKKFQEDHPKFFSFFSAVRDDVREGAVIEITITNPEGEKKTANMKVNADDVETINMLLSLTGK